MKCQWQPTRIAAHLLTLPALCLHCTVPTDARPEPVPCGDQAGPLPRSCRPASASFPDGVARAAGAEPACADGGRRDAQPVQLAARPQVGCGTTIIYDVTSNSGIVVSVVDGILGQLLSPGLVELHGSHFHGQWAVWDCQLASRSWRASLERSSCELMPAVDACKPGCGDPVVGCMITNLHPVSALFISQLTVGRHDRLWQCTKYGPPLNPEPQASRPGAGRARAARAAGHHHRRRHRVQGAEQLHHQGGGCCHDGILGRALQACAGQHVCRWVVDLLLVVSVKRLCSFVRGVVSPCCVGAGVDVGCRLHRPNDLHLH